MNTIRKGLRRLATVTGMAVSAIGLIALPAWAATGGTDLDFEPVAPPGIDAFASDFVGWVVWGARISGFVGVLVCAILIMLGKRGRSSTAIDAAGHLVWVFFGMALVSFAPDIVNTIMG